MVRLRVHNLSISLDGYVAGPNQSREEPLGHDGERLHDWMFVDPDPVDHRFWAAGQDGIGATIMGRNMFGPVRGAWGDEQWKGWWGDDPPFHHDVFVLTHHAHEPIPMQGDTTFHFVTDGIESALTQATAAAGGLDVRLGGGASTVQEFVRAGLVDELHLAVVPILLGGGERLFDHLDGARARLECAELASSPRVAHVLLVRR